MAEPLEDGPPLPSKPGLSRPWRIVIRVVVYVVAILVVLRLVGLLVVLAPTDRSRAERIEDQNSLRNIALLVIVAGPVPLAPDGRIDVYSLLTEDESGAVDRRMIVEICRSTRAGKGPTWEEIRAGDYGKFPYQRYRGVLDRESYARVPILWDRKATKGRRLAAFSDGSALFEDEATFQEFFRNNPGQE